MGEIVVGNPLVAPPAKPRAALKRAGANLYLLQRAGAAPPTKPRAALKLILLLVVVEEILAAPPTKPRAALKLQRQVRLYRTHHGLHHSQSRVRH